MLVLPKDFPGIEEYVRLLFSPGTAEEHFKRKAALEKELLGPFHELGFSLTEGPFMDRNEPVLYVEPPFQDARWSRWGRLLTRQYWQP